MAATGKSKEERRRDRDMLAARQAGTMQPEHDVATGRAINPHIPEWMAKASWYQDDNQGPSLKHQKAAVQYNADPAKLHHFAKTAIVGRASKFRKGACENCGSITHKRKDCLERPRKVGAVFNGKDIAADEILIDSKGEGWDEKRDRWAGYDSTAHKRLVLEHEALEEAQRKMREEELDRGVSNNIKSVAKVAKAGKSAKQKEDDDFGSSDESGEEDETKYAEGVDVAGQHVDTKNRVTVRNLRIREDTAKYLRNLDIDSSYYDPKSRSMREAPDKSVNPLDTAYAGDNFQRYSGQAADVQALDVFAWNAEQRGSTVNVQTNPTQAALVYKEFLQKKETLKDTSSKSILDKYGGEQYLTRPAKELLEGQSENYVEYDRSTGALVKGLERAKAVSKYAEDFYPGNHTSVWGSYWANGQWGFSCCHSFLKSSYCVGEVGKQEAVRASRMLAISDGQEESDSRKRKNDQDSDEPPAKRVETSLKPGVRHNRFEQVSEQDMERFQAERKQFEDPLRNLGKDELLPL